MKSSETNSLPHQELAVVREALLTLPNTSYDEARVWNAKGLAALDSLEEQFDSALAALRSIESMAGAGGSGEIPAMPIAAKAREVLYPASRRSWRS